MRLSLPQLPQRLAFHLLALDGFPLVVLAFAFDQSDFQFRLAVSEVEFERDERIAFLFGFAPQAFDLPAVHQQFAFAAWLVSGVACVFVGRDMHVHDPQFPIFHATISVREAHFACRDRFDLRAGERHSRLVGVFYMVVVVGFAVRRDELNPAI